MKKIIFIMSLFVMTSCSNTEKGYRDAQTQFIITSINKVYGMEKMISYQVQVVDVNGLSKGIDGKENLSFWFSDTIGKYKLGQPIHFDKNR